MSCKPASSKPFAIVATGSCGCVPVLASLPLVATYIIFPGILIKSIAPKSRSFVVSVFVVTLAKLPVAQRFVAVPIL